MIPSDETLRIVLLLTGDSPRVHVTIFAVQRAVLPGAPATDGVAAGLPLSAEMNLAVPVRDRCIVLT